jgi:hypothetical protein
MIEVRVRDEHFVDSPNAARPKERRDAPFGHFGASGRASIVEQDTAVRSLETTQLPYSTARTVMRIHLNQTRQANTE